MYFGNLNTRLTQFCQFKNKLKTKGDIYNETYPRDGYNHSLFDCSTPYLKLKKCCTQGPKFRILGITEQ